MLFAHIQNEKIPSLHEFLVGKSYCTPISFYPLLDIVDFSFDLVRKLKIKIYAKIFHKYIVWLRDNPI
jgi:hypothetical protein